MSNSASASTSSSTSYDAWNPGVESPIPEELRPLATIFRPENVVTTVAAARELCDLTGLDIDELVAFRPQRLALHELLIRATANISVPMGERMGDLGVNFRRLTRSIHARYIGAHGDAVQAAYHAVKIVSSKLAAAEVEKAFSTAAPAALVAEWERKAAEARDAAHRATYRALAKIVSALLVRHGRVWGVREVIASLACDLACNDAGSEAIGALIEPWVIEGAKREGYGILPRQAEPVVMNTKGPSASGKSSLRPLQRHLAAQIGVSWDEFCLVSPDIWRKQLLDYDSLGAAFRYAGPFTGEELRIVDLKLDRYMAAKAERGQMSHLLIDRFRFDSFAPDSHEAGSNLLTRFGHTVYLFFMITPPGMLVERAWTRGLEFGRYKAVEDTLAHGVEAYAGMPDLFFTWVRRTDKRVHFEFLDNSVALGERPRTIAFGWNGVIHIVDRNGLIDVERFRRVNIGARSPDELWPHSDALAAERNTKFLEQCTSGFPGVHCGDPRTADDRMNTLGR